MKLREHLFALLIHGGILAAIAIVVLTTSCDSGKPVATDPARDFFRKIQSALDTAGAKDVTVIQVTDSVNAGPDLKRQVLEEIQSRLHALNGVGIIEYPETRLDSEFKSMNVNPSDGISPDDAKALASKLQTAALLYASIESTVPDVHFKIYAGSTGQIIFANMLSGWVLPVTKPQQDTSGSADASPAPTGTADVGAAKSSGTTKTGG